MNGRSSPDILGEPLRIFVNWITTHFLAFMVGCGAVGMPVGVSYSLLMGYDE